MRVSGIVFDCDGTLLDSIEAWLAVQDGLAAQVGRDVTDEETQILNTLTVPETAKFFHENFGIGKSADAVLKMVEDLMRAQYQEKTKARSGALSFVKQVSELGVRCSVASSTPQDLLQIGLRHAGFLPYLTAVVSVDDVGASKREPAVYDRARELMGTPKESTWVFEDSSYALKTAIAAGYHTVGVYDRDISGTLEELSVADIVVSDFAELDASQFALPSTNGAEVQRLLQ